MTNVNAVGVDCCYKYLGILVLIAVIESFKGSTYKAVLFQMCACAEQAKE